MYTYLYKNKNQYRNSKINGKIKIGDINGF